MASKKELESEILNIKNELRYLIESGEKSEKLADKFISLDARVSVMDNEILKLENEFQNVSTENLRNTIDDLKIVRDEIQKIYDTLERRIQALNDDVFSTLERRVDELQRSIELVDNDHQAVFQDIRQECSSEMSNAYSVIDRENELIKHRIDDIETKVESIKSNTSINSWFIIGIGIVLVAISIYKTFF